MSEIQNLLAMNRFLNQVFEDTEINEMEQDIFSKFNSAVSAVVKPTVRLHCRQAGFSKESLKNSQSFKKDPIFLSFPKVAQLGIGQQSGARDRRRHWRHLEGVSARIAEKRQHVLRSY